MTVAVIACLRTEELYVKEWIDWNLSCGVDHIFLCDNNDPDYFPKLESVVGLYPQVTILDYKGQTYIQPRCYADVYNSYGKKYDWFLIIDIDEFICLPKYNNELKKYLGTVPNDVKCIGINWRYYGDNGYLTYDPRPVQKRFTQPVNKGNIVDGRSQVTKSIIRGKKYFDYDRQIVHQHCAIYKAKSDTGEHFYDVLFNKLLPYTNNLNKGEEYFKSIYSIFYIKHFYTKTIEEYIKYKIIRGNVIPDDKKHKYKISDFFTFNEETEAKKRVVKFYENFFSQ